MAADVQSLTSVPECLGHSGISAGAPLHVTPLLSCSCGLWSRGWGSKGIGGGVLQSFTLFLLFLA